MRGAGYYNSSRRRASEDKGGASPRFTLQSEFSKHRIACVDSFTP
jgi:hypothetical protein